MSYHLGKEETLEEAIERRITTGKSGEEFRAGITSAVVPAVLISLFFLWAIFGKRKR